MIMSRRVVVSALAGFVIVRPAFARGPGVSKDARGAAIQGFDTRAYWREGAARPGDPSVVVDWQGAAWHFGSAEEAARFAENPAAFAPRFGGFCTRAMSFKKVVDGDPEVWRIFEGGLYLFARPVGGRAFDKGQIEMIRKAQAHWERLNG